MILELATNDYITGETVVIARNGQRVAVQSLSSSEEPAIAPPGYFANDYDASEIAELNALAARGPQTPLP